MAVVALPLTWNVSIAVHISNVPFPRLRIDDRT